MYFGTDPPIPKGSLGLTSSSSIKGAAYVSRHALVLGRVVAASPRGNLPSLLKRLPGRPMASALLEELKTMATEVKKHQREDAVGISWAALAAKENPQGRGIGTLLVEAGGGGGGGRVRGGRGGRRAGEIGDPQGRGIWALPGRSGSRRRGGGGGGDGRAAGEGERGGRGGGGVEQREQWEDPLVTQPDGENGLSQTI